MGASKIIFLAREPLSRLLLYRLLPTLLPDTLHTLPSNVRYLSMIHLISTASVVDSDPNWISIQELCGSGSVLQIRIRIHTDEIRINKKVEHKIQNSETQLTKNFFR